MSLTLKIDALHLRMFCLYGSAYPEQRPPELYYKFIILLLIVHWFIMM